MNQKTYTKEELVALIDKIDYNGGGDQNDRVQWWGKPFHHYRPNGQKRSGAHDEL